LIGPSTIAALGVYRSSRAPDQLAMERMRWLPEV
jgi:murein L,D-transpeptidase YcbB/YkuD